MGSKVHAEGYTSSDTAASSPELPSHVLKAALSTLSSAPYVGNRPVGATDKEREKLLYPGRVNLTSKHPSVCFRIIVLFI